MTRRPNILLIMTDQQRWDSLGYAGGRPADTPNLDALAATGTIFDYAYSGSVSCVPARSSLLTGLLHHRVPTVGANARAQTTNGLALKPGFWTIAHALKQAGYQTALLGKLHAFPMRADHGFEQMRLCEHLPAGYEANDEDDYRQWLQTTGRKDRRFVRPSQPGVFPYPEEYHPTAWITRQGLDFLENRDSTRPYFAVVSYTAPHTPYDPPQSYALRYPPEDIDLPCEGLEVNEHLPWPFDLAVQPPKNDGIFRVKYTARMPDAEIRAVLAAICALNKQIDDAVGDLMKQVDLSDTVLFFLSDHGDYGGHRGFLGKITCLPFDDLARVPFFVVGAGVVGERRIVSPVQSFDFVPTALELAGVAPPSGEMDAQSLADVLHGGQADENRAVFCSTTHGWPMLRRGRFKHIWHSGADVSLLYDMQADPGETRNLAEDPAHAGLLEENVEILRNVLERPVPDWRMAR